MVLLLRFKAEVCDKKTVLGYKFHLAMIVWSGEVAAEVIGLSSWMYLMFSFEVVVGYVFSVVYRLV